jgi:adenylate cyclase
VSESGSSGPTGKQQDRRKLVAIVYADMVGYSRLIGLDDQGTLDRLRALRRDVIDPAIAEHGGKLVQTGGDSLLIIFDSIDGAVRCAVKIQEQVPTHDDDQPANRAIRFRMGINIGDAIADGTDLHGDAVNIAARLEAECPIGGVCVSSAVYDHVQGKLSVAFEPIGVLKLKNIRRPIEAYVAKPDPTPTTTRVMERPSLLVMAFDSPDPEQEFIADGIAEDITTILSRIQSFTAPPVIDASSGRYYRERSSDVRQITHELGVRYVLQGMIRRSGKRMRIVARLIATETAGQIWTERYEHDIADVFKMQDEISRAVAHAIWPVLADAELGRAMRKPTTDLDAWELYQRGMWHLRRSILTDSEQALGYFHKAIAIDPMFIQPYMAIAHVHCLEGVAWYTRPLESAVRLLTEWVGRAFEIDPHDPLTLSGIAYSHFFAGDHASVLRLTDQVLTEHPYALQAILVRGRALLWSGHPAAGRELLSRALRISPHDPVKPFILADFPLSHYFERDYQRAADVARSLTVAYPRHPWAFQSLAVALGQLGRCDEAFVALREAISISPRSFALTGQRLPWERTEDYEHYREGLRKAGWNG